MRRLSLLYLFILSPARAADFAEFSADGKVTINGAAFVEGASAGEPQIYAEVAKVVNGPEGSVVLYLRPVELRRSGGPLKEALRGEPRPFVAEHGWTYLTAEGKATSDARLAAHVVFSHPVDLTGTDFTAKWNECDGSITGNYTGMPCNQNRFLADDYVVFLRAHLLDCVNQALGKVGAPAAAKAHIVHDGTSPNERHKATSLHTAGRAIDVQTMTLTRADGGTETFDFRVTSAQPEGRDHRFYDGLRACWHRVHKARRCPGRKDGPIGSIGWEDDAHRGHHLHLSYPFCPNSRGYAITRR